jgi:S-(hydroxymethyl)glutathione dehydrogenase/alcohol dehydrogenase
VGTPLTIRAAWGAARRGGTVVIVGAGRADQQVEFTSFELLFDGKQRLASVYGSADVGRDFPRLVSLWRAGRLDLEGMITQRIRLDDLDRALAALGQGDVIRQVVIHDWPRGRAGRAPVIPARPRPRAARPVTPIPG